ncbi:MAG: hypothetical protein KDI51_01895, partial [Xanthomonadales bacterium]|nr:hypothetical protein [Xanthomonadales bacterium]
MAGVIDVVNALVVLVLVNAALGHEPGVVEHIRCVGPGLAAALVAVAAFVVLIVSGGTRGLRRRLHFDQVFPGEEAAIGQQRLVDRAELVDRQQLVTDPTTPLAAALAAAERHQRDDLLPQPVGKAHAIEQRRGGRVEQAAVQRRQRKGIAHGGGMSAQTLHLRVAGAGMDQPEQPRQALV